MASVTHAISAPGEFRDLEEELRDPINRERRHTGDLWKVKNPDFRARNPGS